MPTDAKNSARLALDKVIGKSRVHMYKPIRIAEILFRHRTDNVVWNLKDLESYRNQSKRWGDRVSKLLVGRTSTSSQKYQDNVFGSNALPPNLLAHLGQINKKGGGFVEAYIYKAVEARLSSIHAAYNYVKSSKADDFSLTELVGMFQVTQGLRRSAGNMYEILVHALFATIVRVLKARVILEIENRDKDVLKDFELFVETVLGITAERTSFVQSAALYRVGVANSADAGLDIWANFGPAIQVKHLTLTAELAEDMAADVTADRIVIICLDAEKESVESLLRQVGLGERIQGVVTLGDLDDWYKLCLSEKYRNKLGANLLEDISKEFAVEFPSSEKIGPFVKERGYSKIAMPSEWEIGN